MVLFIDNSRDTPSLDSMLTSNHMLETEKLQNEVSMAIHQPILLFYCAYCIAIIIDFEQISSLKKQLTQKEQIVREKDKQVKLLIKISVCLGEGIEWCHMTSQTKSTPFW